MNITVAKERIFLYRDQILPADAQKIALEKKLISFDAVSKVASFLSRPKDDDFECTYSEHRYQPFWRVAASAHYEYDRKAEYTAAASGDEVRSVTILDHTFQTNRTQVTFPVMEHCIQEEHTEVTVDGVSGKTDSHFSKYGKFQAEEMKGEWEAKLPKASILIPPQVRVSALMRDCLSKMIKGIQADTMKEERVEVTAVELYYYPVYAFKYHWKSRGKDAILEVDGVNGDASAGNRTFSEFIGKVLDRNFLFDVGADAAGIFIPGGSIAVKVAKQYIDKRKHAP